jgi:hypothetical protein
MSHTSMMNETSPGKKKSSDSELPRQQERHPEPSEVVSRLRNIHEAKKCLARQLHEVGFSMEEIGRILHLRKKSQV